MGCSRSISRQDLFKAVNFLQNAYGGYPASFTLK